MIDVRRLQEVIGELEQARDSAWLAAGWAKTWQGGAHARDCAHRLNGAIREARAIAFEAFEEEAAE